MLNHNHGMLSSTRFQTELGYDFLEIHDGPNLLSPLIGSFNGTQVPQFLFSSSNFLYLLFTTDNSRSNVGFKILYESKLGTNPPCRHELIAIEVAFVDPSEEFRKTYVSTQNMQAEMKIYFWRYFPHSRILITLIIRRHWVTASHSPPTTQFHRPTLCWGHYLHENKQQ